MNHFTVLVMISFIPPLIRGNTYKSCAPEKHCVPYELCSEDYKMDGRFYPDRNRTLRDYLLCRHMEKCCHVKDTIAVCRPYKSFLLQQGKCGSRLDLGFEERPSANKQDVMFAEFPWLVAIYNVDGYLCSGALISPRAVLTAAHCIRDQSKDELRLVAGEWDAAVETEPLPYQRRTVSELLLHSSYKPSQTTYNLALLTTHPEKPFDLTDHVQVICLPSPQITHNLRDCYVAGWRGVDFHKNETLPKHSSLNVLPRDQCVSKLRMLLTPVETLLCAVGEKDNFGCGNQNAIPLMCLLSGSNNTFALVGLLARETHCEGHQLLGVYTNVLLYRNWIDLQLKEHDLATFD